MSNTGNENNAEDFDPFEDHKNTCIKAEIQSVLMKKKYGHIFHSCQSNEEWDSHPISGLDYQEDLRNEECYSIYTEQELKKISRDVRVTGNFELGHLYHMDDSCKEWLDVFLTANILDRWDDLEFLADLHHGFFGNPYIARILCIAALEQSDVDDVIKLLLERHGDENEDFIAEFRVFLESIAKEKFKDELESQLMTKTIKHPIKI